MTVADKVRHLREELGMSQEQLAHKMGLKSRSSITRIEKSGDDITLKDIERLSKALGCSPLYLMGWDDETEQNEEEKRIERFKHFYSQLNEEQKTIIDNLLASLVKKQ